MQFNYTFLKIDHYCGRSERKMRREGLILIKLLSDKNFKQWTFLPVSYVCVDYWTFKTLNHGQSHILYAGNV